MAVTVQATHNGSNSNWANSVSGQTGSLQDQFMEILLTQLRYQDPMEPMKEKDFFAQMAQFTTATQMQNLNTNVSWLCSYMADSQLGKNLLEAAHLVGKEFQASALQGTITGVVEGVGLSSGRLVVRSGGQSIPIEDLIWIGGAAHGIEDHQQ
ncbi:MAG: flagellar hook assembly protein FlgD [Bacillota bacterium]